MRTARLSSGGGCIPDGCHPCPFALWDVCTPRGQTNACKNITFPQLRSRAVINLNTGKILEFCYSGKVGTLSGLFCQ